MSVSAVPLVLSGIAKQDVVKDKKITMNKSLAMMPQHAPVRNERRGRAQAVEAWQPE